MKVRILMEKVDAEMLLSAKEQGLVVNGDGVKEKMDAINRKMFRIMLLVDVKLVYSVVRIIKMMHNQLHKRLWNHVLHWYQCTMNLHQNLLQLLHSKVIMD
jgi:hypothetical protein